MTIESDTKFADTIKGRRQSNLNQSRMVSMNSQMPQNRRYKVI